MKIPFSFRRFTMFYRLFEEKALVVCHGDLLELQMTSQQLSERFGAREFDATALELQDPQPRALGTRLAELPKAFAAQDVLAQLQHLQPFN